MKTVAVIGAGTMGRGIAQVFAQASHRVYLCDEREATASAALTRIKESLGRAVGRQKIAQDVADEAAANLTAATVAALPADVELVVEAVPEQLGLKKTILSEAAGRCPEALLASNTSSLSLTEMAAALPRPDRVVGLHFFNPPPAMRLLEIVLPEQAPADMGERMRALAATIGKDPIVVRDTPGFATSRLGIILGMEAIRMLESGTASVADIDRAMELGYRHPMGPLKLTDLVGLDVRLAIAEHLTAEIGPQFRPPPLLRRMVRAGRLGKKTGHGFYRWVDGEAKP